MVKMSRKSTGEKRIEKQQKRTQNGTKRGENPPGSPATLEPGVAWRPRKPQFSPFFRDSKSPASGTFQNSWFWDTKSSDIRPKHGSIIKSIENNIDRHPVNQKKCAFYPTDREIDRTDGTDPLLATNTWNYMIIWCRSTWRSIDDHQQKNPKRRGTARDSSAARRPLNAINWLALLQSLIHFFGRPNQKQAFGSYKSRDSWHLTHETPPIMAIKGD